MMKILKGTMQDDILEEMEHWSLSTVDEWQQRLGMV